MASVLAKNAKLWETGSCPNGIKCAMAQWRNGADDGGAGVEYDCVTDAGGPGCAVAGAALGPQARARRLKHASVLGRGPEAW
jgi:hypothetical protein